MILLVEPMVAKSEAEIQQSVQPYVKGKNHMDWFISRDDLLSTCFNVAAAALTIASPFAVFLVAAGIGIVALKFLYSTYKKM